MTTTPRGPFRQQHWAETTNEDDERTPQKNGRQILSSLVSVCCGPSALARTNTHTHENSDINIFFFFWYLASQAFGTNILLARSSVRHSTSQATKLCSISQEDFCMQRPNSFSCYQTVVITHYTASPLQTLLWPLLRPAQKDQRTRVREQSSSKPVLQPSGKQHLL